MRRWKPRVKTLIDRGTVRLRPTDLHRGVARVTAVDVIVYREDT